MISDLGSMGTLNNLRHALTLNDFVFPAIYLQPTDKQWQQLQKALVSTAEPTDEQLNDPELLRLVEEVENEANEAYM